MVIDHCLLSLELLQQLPLLHLTGTFPKDENYGVHIYYFPSNLPVKLGDVSGDPCLSRTMVLRGDIRKLPYLYTIYSLSDFSHDPYKE